ncbi:hypothetical protein [Variovorax paradoxus]|uniref:hypothetical protein n=1 Tax=Variovorax paradoxus TaxID=34073 RepID=UPI003ECCC3FA
MTNPYWGASFGVNVYHRIFFHANGLAPGKPPEGAFVAPAHFCMLRTMPYAFDAR